MVLSWGWLAILPTASGPISRGSAVSTRGLVGVRCGSPLGWLPGALGAFLWLLGLLAFGLMSDLTGGAPPGSRLGSCRMSSARCRGPRRACRLIAGVSGTRVGLLAAGLLT